MKTEKGEWFGDMSKWEAYNQRIKLSGRVRPIGISGMELNDGVITSLRLRRGVPSRRDVVGGSYIDTYLGMNPSVAAVITSKGSEDDYHFNPQPEDIWVWYTSPMTIKGGDFEVYKKWSYCWDEKRREMRPWLAAHHFCRVQAEICYGVADEIAAMPDVDSNWMLNEALIDDLRHGGQWGYLALYFRYHDQALTWGSRLEDDEVMDIRGRKFRVGDMRQKIR